MKNYNVMFTEKQQKDLHYHLEKLSNMNIVRAKHLKFKENVPKYGRTTNNSFLGNVGTTCLGTYKLSKNFLIHLSIMLTG